MPKFNSKEEYEAWKARKLAESGAKPAQQPKQSQEAPPQATRPGQPGQPPAQQGSQPGQRPPQRPGVPPQEARPAAQRPQPRQAPPSGQGTGSTRPPQPQKTGQGARPGQPAQRPQTRQAGAVAAAGGAQRQAPPRKAAPHAGGATAGDQPRQGRTLDEIIAADPSLRPPGYKDRDEVPDTRTYFERVPEAFTYPFKGHGKYMLIGGVIMMVVVRILSFSPILAILLGITVFGFVGSYMMKIITHSSDGEEEPPDWPDFSEFGSDIIAPAFQLLWTMLVAYFPVIALAIYLRPIEGLPDQAMLLGVKLICSVYFPMALIVMSHSRSYLSVGPHMVLPAICKVPGDYIIAVVVLQLALILKSILERVLLHIPILGGLIATVISLYLIMASMHLLGLVYYKNRTVLNWWGEEEEY